MFKTIKFFKKASEDCSAYFIFYHKLPSFCPQSLLGVNIPHCNPCKSGTDALQKIYCNKFTFGYVSTAQKTEVFH